MIPSAASALGVAGVGDVRRLGRIGLKTLAYTVVVSLVAVLIGCLLLGEPLSGAQIAGGATVMAGSLLVLTTGRLFCSRYVGTLPVKIS